jgi:hypothetical protein
MKGERNYNIPTGMSATNGDSTRAAVMLTLFFSNGHDSLGRYIVPLGNDDSTFGRATMNNFTVTNYDTNKNAGIHTQTAAFVQRAHLAGVWMGETTEYAHKDGGNG